MPVVTPNADRQKKEKTAPFLLFLRTSLYEQLFNKKKEIFKFPEQKCALGEKPFKITHKQKETAGIMVEHSDANTTFKLLDINDESSHILLVEALAALAEANRRKPSIKGVVHSTQFELSITLHIEDLSQLDMMLRIGDQSNIPVSHYLLNGEPIDPAIIKQARAHIDAHPIPSGPHIDARPILSGPQVAPAA